MKITLTNIIEIKEPTKEILDYCKKELTFSNPDYIKKQRMGFWTGKTPKTISLYDYYQGNIYLPIGCFNDIWEIYPYKENYVDYTTTKKADIKSNIILRDYQKPCTDALKKYVNGIFILFAGAGKTQIALQCASELKQKTLFLVHTKDLLNQSKERCESNLICKTSTITEGKCDISGDIVFATVQTLVNFVDKREISQDEFGLVVVDECHHLSTSAESVKMFEKCVNYFNARYKLGISATLHRSDGLQNTTKKILGDVIYELKKSEDKTKFIGYYENKPIIEVSASMFQVPAQIHLVETKYKPNDECFDTSSRIIFSTLISDLATNSDRNKQVLDIINKLDSYTIVISERTSQLEYLHKKVPSSIYINGKTPKKKREQEIEEFRQGKHKVLFATYSLVAEGLDIPILENLIMASPVKDERLVIQAIGRCQRPSGDKKIANVYDLVDDVSILDKFTRKRKSVYKKEGWEIIYGI
jgi:superfamily II DNA or RNA helicase